MRSKIPPPSQEEVKIAIMLFKNIKAAVPDILPFELCKTRCNELVGWMHQLIYKIWQEENMSNYCKFSVLSVPEKLRS